MTLRDVFCTVACALCAAFASAQPQAPIRVPFLDAVPDIDGVLEAPLSALPVHVLPLQSSSASAASTPAAPTYRIAYGTGFLYVFIEIEATQLAARDRAYQNGDGVVLVVARPRPGDEPSDEFYVLGFSPGTPAARWQQRFVWYRNVGLEMRPLEDARVAAASVGGKSFFEILVPWRDVYPYHPWLSDAIGFNVCVTRALPGTDRARYCAVDDRRVDSEQSERRYQRLSFADPRGTEGVQAVAVLDRNHIAAGDGVRVRLATLTGSAQTVPAVTRVLSGEGTRVASAGASLDLEPGLHVREIDVPVKGLPAGGYTITWQVGDRAGTGLGLSILAAADPGAMAATLAKSRGRLSAGSLTTLQFDVEEIERQRRFLHAYDTATALRVSLDRVVADLGDAQRGTDPVAARRGMFRRAFRSRVDGQLQPYSVKIPDDYRPDRRYPLLVFLHGSGQDDRNELTREWLPADSIQLAPYGRGTSNWYTADRAQDDIREAIEDVCATYSVDAARIVLAGFSMGGYGVYRTYKEDPRRYRALAIFSGIPRVPGGAGDAPDFLDKDDLTVFARVPMFVFHGGKDRNCPIEQTRALLARLKQAGADVQFEFEEDKGHEAPGPATVRAFREWLRRVTRASD